MLWQQGALDGKNDGDAGKGSLQRIFLFIISRSGEISRTVQFMETPRA